MKTTSVKFLASLLAVAIFMLVSSESYSQTKGSSVKTGTVSSTDNITSVTKVFEFTSGGIDIDPISGDLTYIVYEKPTLGTTSWTKTDSGTIKSTDDKVIEICKTSAAALKVEIKLDCDSCADVQTTDCKN
jgi:hypothetical protein